jgi:hypothetical protein
LPDSYSLWQISAKQRYRREGTEMRTLLLTCAVVLCAAPLYARSIEQACNNSQRNAEPATCSCIQKVADIKLSRGDQKQAAKFFADPQLAQDTRQSDNPSKERFWLRYKAFGVLAAEHCSSS